MSESQKTINYPVIKINGQEKVVMQEPVVEEIPLTVFLNGKELITMLAMAGEERYLVTGFLATEGIIRKVEDIQKLEIDTAQGIIYVETPAADNVAEKMFLKRYLTACCGKGRSSFYFANDISTVQTITGGVSLAPEEIISYSQQLEEHSELFRQTGGVHSGALAAGGKLVYYSQDIGRHNVFDKLFGRCIYDNVSTQDKIIVFSGRVSSEILLKVSKMNISMIIARSAPTTLALDMAEELGITVIGFARGQRMNIYTHPERVYGASSFK
ncbi:MAG TPA: formate dehydrogenase accessory sulfurtransferase FdhD [Patescibacteria group bacterium]|nr:formate dehydrogenase accessory sulfurtransferase FdhD [Patescibacteria group bacterium]